MKELTSSVLELCRHLTDLICRECDPYRKNELTEQCRVLRTIVEKVNGFEGKLDPSGFKECKAKLNSLNHYMKKMEQRETRSSVTIPDFSTIAAHVDKVISGCD